MEGPSARAATIRREGQMTAVMRAVTRPPTPRLLRVAVVLRGAVVEERVLAARSHVTVGPNERATFVVASGALPSAVRLFEATRSGYTLHVLPGMSGRIATRAGIVDLATARDIALGDDARGRIALGEATLLFQFVDAPPPLQKPQLPLAVRGGLADGVDWTTAIVAAFSFLFHFGVVASLYGDWLDTVVDDEARVAQLVDSLRPPVTVPLVEKSEMETTATAAPTAAREAQGAGATARKSGTGSGTRSGTGGRREAADAMMGQLEKMNLEMVGVMNAHGRSTEDVLRAGVPTDLLNDAAKDAAGAGRGNVAGLEMGTSSHRFRPGGGGRGLGDIGNTRGTGPVSAGAAVAAPRPIGVAQVGGPLQPGGEVPNVGGVVAGMSPGFRRCYTDGLTREDPTMRGSLRITTRIGPNGDVLSASPSGGGTLSSTVIACVTARVQSAHFDAPTGGGATIVIPVTFVPQ
jgi:hypothetical protein